MKGIKSIALFAALLLFVGCSTYKQVPYLQDSKNFVARPQDSSIALYDARIMPKDQITITVSASDRSTVTPFNLVSPTLSTSSVSNSTTSQPALQKYLVDNEGMINFPILGELSVGGLTKGEAERMIVKRLELYLQETPIVTVRMTNYNISVLGEVSKPGVFTIDDEKVNIFEALAQAGDMTIYGQRQNVKLIRESSTGERKVVELDLTNPDIIKSPYYYLQQNDVLYVTPNKVKAKTSDISSSTTIWFSVISTLISLTTLLVAIF